MSTEERPHSWKNLPDPVRDLSSLLQDWYAEEGRHFAWRKTRNPYQVLCAEIMLQRTRAEQVEPVFEDFCDRFEGPAEVVEAEREAVDEIFGQLGLRWRAEYFWELQLTLIERHEGIVPRGMERLLELPGVGRYAATATRVFAFGERETVVDANVLRVFGRWYGIEFPDHARRSPRVSEWASEHAPEAEAATRRFNWALIDLGARICTPSNPDCEVCPLAVRCWYANAWGRRSETEGLGGGSLYG